MRRFDSQRTFLLSVFTVLALAAFVLPACNSNGSGADSGDTGGNDSGSSGIVSATVITSSVPAILASTTGSCLGFEIVGRLMITNRGAKPIEFNNNFNPGEVIDSSPGAGMVGAGDSVGLSIFADCSGGAVNGFLQLDITDVEAGSPNTGSLNAPVSLVAAS